MFEIYSGSSLGTVTDIRNPESSLIQKMVAFGRKNRTSYSYKYQTLSLELAFSEFRSKCGILQFPKYHEI